MPAAVVRTNGNVNSGGGTVSYTSVAPTAGNLLVAAVSYNFSSPGGPGTPPTGWTLWGWSLNQDTLKTAVAYYTKTATSGDTGTTFNAGLDYAAICVWELSGVNTSNPIFSAIGITNEGTANSAAAAIAAMTGYVTGCLVLVAASEQGDGTATGTWSMSTGWTTDQSQVPAFHGLGAFHLTTNPTDTTTPQTGTVTTARGGNTNFAAVTLFINPSGTSAPATNPYIIQVGQTPGTAGTSQTALLGVTPTVGNYLVAVTNNNSGTVTTPGGWTQLGASSTTDSSGVTVLYRQVQGGDGTSWPFTFSVNDYNNIALFEVANAGTPTDFQSSIAGVAAPNLTGVPTGALVFNGFGQESGAQNTTTQFSTSSPWANPGFIWDGWRPISVYTSTATSSSVTGLSQSGFTDAGAIPAVSFYIPAAGAAPTVTTGSAVTITPTSVTFQGTVNPNGADTTFAFNWGLTNAYGNTTAPAVDIGSGSSTLNVQDIQLTGLTPNTTYHFQITATNGQGTTTGSDATFTTQSQGADWNPYLGDPSWFFGGPHPFDFFAVRLFEPMGTGQGTINITAAIAAVLAIVANNTEAETTTATIAASATVTPNNTETVALTCAIAASAAVTAANTEAEANTCAILASASVTAADSVLVGEAVSISSSASVTANNTEAATTSSSISASGSVTTSNTETALVACSVTASCSCSGNLTGNNNVAISASASVLAANTETATTSSSISASADVEAANTEAAQISSSIGASAAVTAANTESVALSTSITASATVTASNTESAALSVAIVSSASVTAANTEAAALSVAITSSASITTSNTETALVACSISATCTCTGNVQSPNGVAIVSTAAVTATNTEAATTSAAISATASVTGNNTETAPLASSISASGAITAANTEALANTSTISGTSSVTTANTEVGLLATAVSCSGSVTAGTTIHVGELVQIAASATVTANDRVHVGESAAIVCSCVVTASLAPQAAQITVFAQGYTRQVSATGYLRAINSQGYPRNTVATAYS